MIRTYEVQESSKGKHVLFIKSKFFRRLTFRRALSFIYNIKPKLYCTLAAFHAASRLLIRILVCFKMWSSLTVGLTMKQND
jgi:hypothetical protein